MARQVVMYNYYIYGLKLILWVVYSVALFLDVNEHSQSNRDCSFLSSIKCFASGRSSPDY